MTAVVAFILVTIAALCLLRWSLHMRADMFIWGLIPRLVCTLELRLLARSISVMTLLLVRTFLSLTITMNTLIPSFLSGCRATGS